MTDPISEYINRSPENVRNKLIQIRNLIKDIAPEAKEKISYGMPAFFQNGPIAYYAGYKNHIGFYPTPAGINAFEGEMSVYKYSKGAVQFKLDEDLPLELIKKIVEYKLRENLG